MKLFRFAIMLLLVQLSPIFVRGQDETVFECNGERTSNAKVEKFNAQLTKGCILRDVVITFDLEAMYDDAEKTPNTPNTPVVINISEAAFINSYIKLINIPDDIGTKGPLLFTMIKSNMSGSSRLQFGSRDKPFKLPPNSRIRIIDSKLTISPQAANAYHYMFTFYNLTLEANSSMEIARNVITMECKGCDGMAVFYFPTSAEMKVSDKSSFTLQDNNITITGHTAGFLRQYVWYQYDTSPLTISDNSIYTWLGNIISIVGHVTDQQQQYVWYQGSSSPLTVTETSTYTWEFNTIDIVGYKVEMLFQEVFYQYINSYLTISQASTYTWVSNVISILGYDVTNFLIQYVLYQEHSPLTISDTSKYTWSMNSISMNGHDVTKTADVKDMSQYVWYTSSPITISASGEFLFKSNKILLLAKEYGSIKSAVMILWGGGILGDISKGTMEWRDNCVGMGHKETDKRHMFAGVLTISGGSVLLDGNYITTTDQYEQSDGDGLTQLVWGPKGDTYITIRPDALNSRNTKVRANSANSGATGSMLWVSSPFTNKASVGLSAIEWSSSPAKDGSGAPIPTLDNSNIGRYMCVKSITPTVDVPPNPDKPIPAVTNITPNTAVTNVGGTGISVPEPIVPNPTVITPVSPTSPKADSNPTTTTPKAHSATDAILPTIPGVRGTPTANKPNPAVTKDISPKSVKADSNAKTTTAKVISTTAILSTIPGLLIPTVVFLYLYNW